LENSYQKFAKDVLIIGATTILTALCGIILLPLLTKTLGAHDYGIWKQVEVTVSLMLGFVGLGLPSAMTRFLPAKTNREETREEFYSAFCVVFIVTLVVSIILIVSANFIAGAFFENATQIVRVTGLIILVWSLNLAFLSLFRAFRQMKRYSIFVIADAYGQVGVIAYLVLSGHGLLSIILGVLAIRVLILIILFFQVRSQFGIGRPRFHRIKEYLNFGLPTIPGMIASWVVTSSDRYVIAYFLGAASVGIYSAGYSIGSVILMFSGVLSFVLPPTLSKLYDEGRMEEVKTHLSYSLKYFLAVGIPFVFGAAILSKPVLVLLSTSEIANEGYLITPLIALTTLILVAFQLSGTQILLLVKKTRILGVTWIIGAAINLILNMLVVPRIGILGAAITTLITCTLVGAVIAYYSFRQFRFNIDWLFIIKSLIASVIMSLAVWKISPEGTLTTVLTVMAGIVIYLAVLILLRVFRKEEFEFFKKLFRLT